MAFIISTEYECIVCCSLGQISFGSILLHIFLLNLVRVHPNLRLLGFPSQYLHINQLTNTGARSKL